MFDVTYQESAGSDWIPSIPLSHLSVELPSLTLDDFAEGIDHLALRFERTVHWLRAALDTERLGVTSRRIRASTALLVDDYSERLDPPVFFAMLVKAAEQVGITIDYVGRASGLADSGPPSPCESVWERLDPAAGMRISDGWLADVRLTAPSFRLPRGGSSPTVVAARAFVVDEDGRRAWSAPMVQATWQLARLGLIRDNVVPELLHDYELPGTWGELPVIAQLNPKAMPFAAYRAVSLTSGVLDQTVFAANTLLAHVVPDNRLVEQMRKRAAHERVAYEPAFLDRIDYRATSTQVTSPPRSDGGGVLPDPDTSRIVLLGASTFTDSRFSEDIPAVRNNAADLAAVLTDQEFGGFSSARTHNLVDTGNQIAQLADLAADVTDTLLVYYTGHGVVAEDGSLLLTRSDTMKGREVYTADRYDLLRSAVLENDARCRIVILDCCFAGRAIGQALGADVAQLEIYGGYLLTATKANEPTYVLPGRRNSVFTEELLDLLRTGIPGGERLIRLDQIYQELLRRARIKQRPEPHQIGRDTIGDLAIVRNRARQR